MGMLMLLVLLLLVLLLILAPTGRLLPHPAPHHGIPSGGCCIPGGASSTTPGSSIHTSTASSEKSAAARSKSKAVLGGTRKSIPELLLRLLHVLLKLLIPSRLFACLLLGLLLQPLDPLKEPVRENISRRCDLHHVVPQMKAGSLAPPAEVVIVADEALVPGPRDGVHVTAVTSHTVVDNFRIVSTGSSSSLLHRLPDSHSQLVERAGHLCQGDDELLVAGDGHVVPVLVSPAHGEHGALDLREDHPQLLQQVLVAGADVLVDDKSSNLLLIVVLQENFEGNVVSHFLFFFVLTRLTFDCNLLASEGPQLSDLHTA